MLNNNFPNNLRLLCSYARSITRVCEQLAINRQQFHRYLNGTSRPSLTNMQAICDYFGVEEHEILMDQNSFRQLVALRKPQGPEVDPFGEYISKLHRINPSASRDMAEYVGYYRCYYRPIEFPGKIQCSLMRLFSERGFTYLKNIENYALAKRRARRMLKYTGVAFHTGERIFVHEREQKAGQMMWTTILYPARRDQVAMLTGLSLGICSATSRDIACYRVVWEPLGQDIDLRATLSACGLFDKDDALIPDDIRAATANDISTGEGGFIGHPWQAF